MQRVQIALGKLRRSRSNKSSTEDATASAKTGADGLEAWKEVVAAGWLVKTGGKGHTVKNSKKRWFVLRGVFLSYYTEDPSKSVYKDREILKGQLYLVGSKISELSQPEGAKDVQSFTITSRGGKEFVITAAKSGESELTLEDWQGHLKKAIDRATTKFSEDAFEGCWLYKKKYNTSWKKRWLLLRGNMLSYFAEIPQKEDSIDGLKGSFDISDVSELTTSNLDPEDEPQVGKRKFVIKMVIDNVRYYLSAPDDETQKLWYTRLKKQMAKIATQYNTAARGVGVMKQYRKSMADFGSPLRSSSDSIRSSTGSLKNSTGSLKNSTGSAPQSEFDQMSQLSPLFKVLFSMDAQDSDIWEGKEWIYPVLRHFSTEVFAAAMTFPVNVISIVFPERGPFGVPRKSYKIDKRMPVHRIVAVIFRSLKLEPKQADPRNYTLQTFGGVILNDQAPLVVYGLGSLLQNWQLKLVPKPPVRKSTTAVAVASPAQGAAPAGNEFPILVVFGDAKFTSKAQRVALHPTTRIDVVISKLCEAQKVKHPSKFVLQTLDGVSLQSNFTLETYGLGKRFKKWELKLVPAKEIDASSLKVVPDGVKYEWVGVDDTLSLLEAKEIIRKLDWAFARTSTSAKKSLVEMQDQLRKVVKKNSKIQKKLDRREKELKSQAAELAGVKASLEKAQTKEKFSLSLAVPAADGPKSSRKASGEKTPRERGISGEKTPRDRKVSGEKTPREEAPEPKEISPAKKTPAPAVPPRRGAGTPRQDAKATPDDSKPETGGSVQDSAQSDVADHVDSGSKATEEPAVVVEAANTPGQTASDDSESSAIAAQVASTDLSSTEADSTQPIPSVETSNTEVIESAEKVDDSATAAEAADAPKSADTPSETAKPAEEMNTSDDKNDQETPVEPAADSVAPAGEHKTDHVHTDDSDSDSDGDSDSGSDDDDEEDDAEEDAAIIAAANATAASLDLLEMEQQLTAKHEEALSALRREYESQLQSLRAELEELKSNASVPLSARRHHPPQDHEEHSASEHSEKESKSEKEKPVVEESIPAAPAPPPPPPAAPAAPEKPAKKEKHSKKEKEPPAAALPGLNGSGGIGSGVLDAISNKKFSLKKVEQPTRKKKGGDDFLRDALEKRFVSMNLDDVEDLDTWDDDASNTSWNDASAWGDDVMRI